MLFNSFVFIFYFLPIVLAVYFLAARFAGGRTALSWLVAASLFFYSWWNPWFFLILAGSMIGNYLFGVLLHKRAAKAALGKKLILAAGVLANIGLLFYYKYSDFILHTLSGTSFTLSNVALPLAISFFTLQQIAYLVDCHKNGICEKDPLKYALFVTFFPQLIAGPIVHHQEMMPQFSSRLVDRRAADRLLIGLAIFSIGLAKKVLLADSLAPYADLIFDQAASGASLTVVEAWLGALCYTFQLYFDFSGYSDMAVGLAFMFGIRLPENFRSPYKASSIISFWRRWHITLSRFLRDYIYIPLGGNRKGHVSRYVNIMIVMGIGGIWHGAGLTFLAWGLFHGVALVVNNAWRSVRYHPIRRTGTAYRIAAQLLTFTVVVIGWVLFRANSLESAQSMISAMFFGNGVSLPVSLGPLLAGVLPPETQLQAWGVRFQGMFHNIDAMYLQYRNIREALPLLFVSFIIVWALPNTQTLFRRYRPFLAPTAPESDQAARSAVSFRLNAVTGTFAGAALILSILSLSGNSPFLYFQF